MDRVVIGQMISHYKILENWAREGWRSCNKTQDRIRTAVLLSGGMASFLGATGNQCGELSWKDEDSGADGERPLTTRLTAQKPMFRLWGATPADKKYVTVASGYAVNVPEVRRSDP